MSFVLAYVRAERKERGITVLRTERQFETSCIGNDNGGEFGNLLDRQIVLCVPSVWLAELQNPEVLDGVCREIRRRRARKAEALKSRH